MKHLKLLIAAGVMAFSFNANAALVTFDFASVADGTSGGTTYGANNGEYGATSIQFTNGGITVTASGYSATDADNNPLIYNAYLDRLITHGRHTKSAGLGVCKTLNTNQCNPSNDDNVTPGEILSLVFDNPVTVNSFTFKNGGHGTKFHDKFKLQIDGNGWDTYDLNSVFRVGQTGTTFELWNDNDDTGKKHQFYLNKMTVSAVPIPAAVWLFCTGLLGLVAVARRKA